MYDVEVKMLSGIRGCMLETGKICQEQKAIEFIKAAGLKNKINPTTTVCLYKQVPIQHMPNH